MFLEKYSDVGRLITHDLINRYILQVTAVKYTSGKCTWSLVHRVSKAVTQSYGTPTLTCGIRTIRGNYIFSKIMSM